MPPHRSRSGNKPPGRSLCRQHRRHGAGRIGATPVQTGRNRPDGAGHERTGEMQQRGETGQSRQTQQPGDDTQRDNHPARGAAQFFRRRLRSQMTAIDILQHQIGGRGQQRIEAGGQRREHHNKNQYRATDAEQIRRHQRADHIRRRHVEVQCGRRQCDEAGDHGNRHPENAGGEIGLEADPFVKGEGAAPPDIRMEDLADTEQQIVEQEHNGRRHQQIQQLRPLFGHGLMHALEPDGVDRQPGEYQNAEQDQQCLNEVGADNRAQTAQHRVEHADGQNDAHAELVVDAGQRIDQNAAGHAQADQPAETVEQRDGEKDTPGGFAVTQTNEITAGEPARHERTNAARQRREQNQPNRTQRVTEHAPDTHLIGELRRGHGGVAGDPGRHRGRGAQRQSDAPTGQHIIVEFLRAPPPEPAQPDPDHTEHCQNAPADRRIENGAVD